MDAVRGVMLAALALSCVGCCFVCFVYVYFRDTRSFAYRLVVYMSLMDIGHAIGFFLPERPESLCKAQAMITSYFSLAAVLWTAALAFTLYDAVVRRKDVASLELKLVIFANGLPLLALIPPLVEGSYGQSGGWCWIQASGKDYYKSGTFWRLMTFYVPLWLVIAFNLFVYVSVIRYLRQQVRLMLLPDASSTKLVRRLRLYPGILIVCYTFPTINRIYQIITEGKTWAPLVLVSGFTMCITGFLNAIVYGLTDTVRERLVGLWQQRSRRGSEA